MKDLLLYGADSLGITLTSGQLQQYEDYARLLVEWNEKMNLTGITEPEEIAVKHFLDSLAGLGRIRQTLETEGEISLIDVGTGAGFPGLALKIAEPRLQLTLLDSLQKRIGFLEAVGQELGLTGVTYLHERAEEGAHKPELREAFDFATARAVASMHILMEYCAGYVKPGGYFLAYKGPTLEEELAESQRAMKVLGLTLTERIPFTAARDLNHTVAVLYKEKSLPLQYPRKQSKIKNTPL